MTHHVYIPTNMGQSPYPHEIFAAKAISIYFDADATFVKRNNTAKTADLRIKNTVWEIKSPIGDGKRTMQNNLRAADDQSPNVIINLARCKMNSIKAVSRIRYELGKANKIKRLLVVYKNGDVVKKK